MCRPWRLVGMLLDLSDLNQDAFVDGAFNSFSVNGVPYAMPFDLPVRVIYNKQVLVKYELGPWKRSRGSSGEGCCR